MVLRGGYVAACSTAFRSATEENDSGGHVDGMAAKVFHVHCKAWQNSIYMTALINYLQGFNYTLPKPSKATILRLVYINNVCGT